MAKPKPIHIVTFQMDAVDYERLKEVVAMSHRTVSGELRRLVYELLDEVEVREAA